MAKPTPAPEETGNAATTGGVIQSSASVAVGTPAQPTPEETGKAISTHDVIQPSASIATDTPVGSILPIPKESNPVPSLPQSGSNVAKPTPEETGSAPSSSGVVQPSVSVAMSASGGSVLPIPKESNSPIPSAMQSGSNTAKPSPEETEKPTTPSGIFPSSASGLTGTPGGSILPIPKESNPPSPSSLQSGSAPAKQSPEETGKQLPSQSTPTTAPSTSGVAIGPSDIPLTRSGPSGGSVLATSGESDLSNPTATPAGSSEIRQGESATPTIPNVGATQTSDASVTIGTDKGGFITGSSAIPHGSEISTPAGTTPTQGVGQSATAPSPYETSEPAKSIGTVEAIPSGSDVVATHGPTAPMAASSPHATPIIMNTISQSYSSNALVTQIPTGYNSLTAQPIPSSIIEAPSASMPTASEDFPPTGIPSTVPKIISPPEGVPTQPENTTLCQIGFLFPLNYKFVLNNDVSQRQIFKYLPMGISDGLNLTLGNVTMQTLRAYDTTQDLGYITTMALFWLPSDHVNMLSFDLHTPTDQIWNNTNPSVKTLMSVINPTIPIRADNSLGGPSPSAGGDSPTYSAAGPVNEGAPIGGSLDNSSPVRASSVGIAAGVVCGAAAYGAAMFFVARRYRKRKQSHRRSPSILSSPVMSGTSPDYMGGANTALMSGGRGDRDRSVSPPNGYYYGRDSRGSGHSGSTGRQQISAPVMAENSLGWN